MSDKYIDATLLIAGGCVSISIACDRAYLVFDPPGIFREKPIVIEDASGDIFDPTKLFFGLEGEELERAQEEFCDHYGAQAVGQWIEMAADRIEELENELKELKQEK